MDDGDEDEVARHEDDEDFSKEKNAATAPSSPPSLRRTSSALILPHNAKTPNKKPLEHHLSSISPRDINFSIISSENTRGVCSCAVAVLVVLSHINLPHKVVKSKSLIVYRPLYAVMLSDVLIVAATLALLSQGKESAKEVKLEKDVNWDGAVKVLEWGLILHQTLRAIFIDCSLYLAIVVCGLSLMQ